MPIVRGRLAPEDGGLVAISNNVFARHIRGRKSRRRNYRRKSLDKAHLLLYRAVMNTALLRLARRHRSGTRYWSVPGFPNQAKLIPSALTMHGWGAAFHWPDRDDKGDLMRGVDLARHRMIAVQAARNLLKGFR